MRITRRTSGGRGEYEISERADRFVPTHLLDKRIVLDLGGDLTVDTGTVLTDQGGKRRLRMLDGTEMQVPRQLAATLMMPHPIRADEAMGGGQPVMQTDRYAIEHILLSRVDLGEDDAVLHVSDVVLRNRSYEAELLYLRERVSRLKRIWRDYSLLPGDIGHLVISHEELVSTGDPVPIDAEGVVKRLQSRLGESSTDLDLAFSPGEDVLEALIQILESAETAVPISLDEIEPEEIELRRRVVKQWRTYAARRGAASARFRKEVRSAYRSTCAMCGASLPSTQFNRTPGVDAAHILPWAEYDMDVVSNGICLCKIHHWAFDESLVRVEFASREYRTVIPGPVKEGLIHVPKFDLDVLLRVQGRIPERRLPADPSQLPNPRFLEELSRTVG